MNKVIRLLSVVLCAGAIAFSAIYVFFIGKVVVAEPAKGYEGVLSLWHVDTFEGGKGSRAAFLNKAARRYEKANHGVYVMTTSFTKEGMKAALAAGKRPDLLSFSCGIDAAEICRMLDFEFSGGEINGKTYAYPWCAGRYYLFCLKDEIGEPKDLPPQEILLSEGGENLPSVAAALCGIRGEVAVADSQTAYVRFLGGKYKYLLGTQRDVCRFASRGVSVYSREIAEYGDLYQYIAVTTKDDGAISACRAFVETLLSEETKGELDGIGMFSVEEVKVESTLSVFADETGMAQVKRESERALSTGEIKILKTYLKSLN